MRSVSATVVPAARHTIKQPGFHRTANGGRAVFFHCLAIPYSARHLSPVRRQNHPPIARYLSVQDAQRYSRKSSDMPLLIQRSSIDEAAWGLTHDLRTPGPPFIALCYVFDRRSPLRSDGPIWSYHCWLFRHRPVSPRHLHVYPPYHHHPIV